MFDFLNRNIFYDKNHCEKIISKYTGDKKMRILRALSSGELNPSDIKRYYNIGHSRYVPDEQYRLINNLSNRKEYTIQRYESGSDVSLLKTIELKITNGKAIITEYWVCA